MTLGEYGDRFDHWDFEGERYHDCLHSLHRLPVPRQGLDYIWRRLTLDALMLDLTGNIDAPMEYQAL